MANPPLAIIIVGAGHSRRMGGVDKLYAPLGSRPLLAVTVAAFDQSPLVHHIVLVVAEERLVYCKKLVQEQGWQKIVAVCTGGSSRSHSVAHGLQALRGIPAEYVGVHDAARPFVTPDLLARGLVAVQQHAAAVPSVPCRDTIKRVDTDDRVLETLPRGQLRSIQTPQLFARSLLEKAYAEQHAHLAKFTDDAAVVEACGHAVYVFEGDYGNIKITTQADLAFAQWQMAWQEKA
jgi:2-C-methyl-D-erythritol 4-phosphate cytidylyltransferase